MILVDTSVWIDFFSTRVNGPKLKFRSALEKDEDIAVCGVVMTEVLQGIRLDSEFHKIKVFLQGLIFLPLKEDEFVYAAEIYRFCRKKGTTIRKPIDCMIAAVCISNSAFILHNDRDFDAIVHCFPLQTY